MDDQGAAATANRRPRVAFGARDADPSLEGPEALVGPQGVEGGVVEVRQQARRALVRGSLQIAEGLGGLPLQRPQPREIVAGDPLRRLDFSYERFLENRLREAYGFFGNPIRIQIRGRKDSRGERRTAAGRAPERRKPVKKGPGSKPAERKPRR